MYPTIKALKRRTSRKFPMPDGRVILPARTRILINFDKVHRDPKHYPDPEKFDPERFAPDSKNERSKYLFLAFGEGPRKCMGKARQKWRFLLILITVDHCSSQWSLNSVSSLYMSLFSGYLIFQAYKWP